MRLYCVFSPRGHVAPSDFYPSSASSGGPQRLRFVASIVPPPFLDPSSSLPWHLVDDISSDRLRLDELLNLGNTREEDVALELLVGELLLDVGEDGLDEVALLLLAELGLVADVRVEDRLDLGGDRGLLLQAERLVLELGGLLRRGGGFARSEYPFQRMPLSGNLLAAAHLGDGKERLGEALDILELSDRVDALLDGAGVGSARGVEDVLDLLLVGTRTGGGLRVSQ